MTAPEGSPLASLRVPVANPHGFRGFGPLLALVVLVVLMVVLAPTVAPEAIVLVPADGPAPTTVGPGTTTTTAPTTSTETTAP